MHSDSLLLDRFPLWFADTAGFYVLVLHLFIEVVIPRFDYADVFSVNDYNYLLLII